MNRTVKITILLGIFVLAALLYYWQLNPENDEPFELTANNHLVSTLRVTGTVASVTDISQAITATAFLFAIQKGKISASISSRVKRLLISEGQKVEAGDSLVLLDSELSRIELEKARGDFFKGLAEFISELIITDAGEAKKWKTHLNNATQNTFLLPLPDSLSRSKLMALVRYDLHHHYARVKQAEQILKQCVIAAPFSGVISGLKVYTGGAVFPGTELFFLTDLSRMRVEISVLESDLTFIKIGTAFKFLDSQRNAYRVSAIHPQIDSGSRLGKVLAVIPNDQKKYKDGQRVMVKLVKQVFTNRLVIPYSAILTRNDRDLVFVVKNGIAKWQYVKMGVSNGELVEIIEGIAVGDTVVTGGHYSLGHDVPVKVTLTENWIENQ